MTEEQFRLMQAIYELSGKQKGVAVTLEDLMKKTGADREFVFRVADSLINCGWLYPLNQVYTLTHTGHEAIRLAVAHD